MITLDQAKALKPGQILYHKLYRNADGSPQRWKVNGKVKTWKKYTSGIAIPVKHGLYNYDYLTQACFDLVCLSEEEALSD